MAEAVRMSRAIATSDGFDDAFPRLYTGALRLALRMLGDRAGAEDVAAEAMARTYASWHKVRHLSYLDAWVLRTTSNLALDALRRRGSGHRALGRMVIRRAVEPADDATATRMALGDALRRLPERQRDSVVLRYLVGLNDREIALALGIAASTVRTHVQSALAALRVALASDLGEVGLATD